jgi:transposase-like protein
MSELEQCFCPNEQCKDCGLRGHGNIGIRAKYGKDKNRDLLYCRTCGKRFAASRASALFGLHLPVETIRQIIHHAAEGVGVRATERLLELDKDTVNRGNLACRRALRTRAFRPADVTAIDRGPARRAVDLCKKKKCSGEPEELEKQYGQTWIWKAIDASTRQLITLWIGGRELDDARQMVRDL